MKHSKLTIARDAELVAPREARDPETVGEGGTPPDALNVFSLTDMRYASCLPWGVDCSRLL